MGKGSRQRPTNKSAFDANFDRIFGKNGSDESTWVHYCVHGGVSNVRKGQACSICDAEEAEKK